MVYSKMESPVGTINIFADNSGLKAVKFEYSKHHIKKLENLYSIENGLKYNLTIAKSICIKTKQQLLEYFEGKRKEFDIPLSPDGTEFQKQVWKFLYTIPYGKLVSYKTVALGIKRPKSYRAVGNANGKNPISIIIPCHRVIAVDKSIGGYSSGLKTKKYLIQLENALPVDNLL